jgi:hypothetical protein
MDDGVVEISKTAVHCLEDALKQWTDTFGTNLQKGWDSPDRVIEEIVAHAAGGLNEGRAGRRREGHCSLFIRVPISDRLKLVWSTVPELRPEQRPDSPHFANMEQNYDPNWQASFYNLRDRLCGNPAAEQARAERGLTGWVAVTGHPVRLNHENDSVVLDRISLDHPESAAMCQHYGQPVWARRISEFHTDTEPWNRRYVAVPIQSVVDPATTIGVLRYTCSDRDPEITRLDQGFLEAMARVISGLENLRRVKIRCHRALLAEANARQFESDGDFSSYLAFIAESTISEIASLYIRLEHKGEARLRLVDAFGISSDVRELRHKKRLHDHTRDKQGLTWKLQFGDFVSLASAAEARGWAGLNTSVFYEEAFRRVGLSDFTSKTHGEQQKFVKSYRIQLLGGGLRVQNNSGKDTVCGVLKVEFPRVFDAESLYDEDDRKFLKECSEVLKQELHLYQQIYDGSWFRHAGPEKAAEYLRLLRGAAKTGLFEGLEEDWKDAAGNYFNNHKEVVAAVLRGDELSMFDTGPTWKVKVARALEFAGPLAAREVVTKLTDLLISSIR